MSYTLLQNEADPTDFTFVETWPDRKAFESHLETPHFKAAAATLAPLAATPTDIRQYYGSDLRGMLGRGGLTPAPTPRWR